MLITEVSYSGVQNGCVIDVIYSVTTISEVQLQPFVIAKPGARFIKCFEICPKIDCKSVVSSPLVILYDLSYTHCNCVL